MNASQPMEWTVAQLAQAVELRYRPIGWEHINLTGDYL